MNGQFRHSPASTATRFGGTPNCPESAEQYHRPPKGGRWWYYSAGLTSSLRPTSPPPTPWRDSALQDDLSGEGFSAAVFQ
jgi:hypothetical protein